MDVVGDVADAYPDGWTACYASTNARALAVADDRSWVVDENGTAWGFGGGAPRATRIAFPRPVFDVAAGDAHAIFLDDSGGVWGLGANERGQLGLGDVSDRRAPARLDRYDVEPRAWAVRCGGRCSFALVGERWLGAAEAWGDAATAGLGLGRRGRAKSCLFDAL